MSSTSPCEGEALSNTGSTSYEHLSCTASPPPHASSDLPAPLTVAEAVGRQNELHAAIEIAVRHHGLCSPVTGQRVPQGVPA